MSPRVFFATNRDPRPGPEGPEDFGKSFSTNGLADLRFGAAEELPDGSFNLSVAPDDPDSLGSRSVFNALKQDMGVEKRDTVVMIHGYATSFLQALKAAFAFREVYKEFDFNVVMFSWPSDGRNLPLDYGNDRHDAAASGLAFARGFMKLLAFLREIKRGEECGQKVHLLAHSMGNYVLRHALQELKKQLPGLPVVFENVFLMAADEDDDAFELAEKLQDLPRLARAVHVYFNRGDKALIASDLTKGNPDRLGHVGPRNPRVIQGKVSLVDASGVVHDLVGHGYYDTAPAVVEDVKAVLRGVEAHEIPGRAYVPDKVCFRLFAASVSKAV